MNILGKVPEWLAGSLVTIIFLIVASSGSSTLFDTVELKSLDYRMAWTASGERHPDIELVVITEDDLQALGPFPWQRSVLARGIENLTLAGAKVIALTVPFSHPEISAGLNALRLLKGQYEKAGLAQQGPGLAFYEELAKRADELDNDARLRESLKKAGNVVLPVYFDVQKPGSDQQVPDFIAHHSFRQIKGADDPRAVSSLYRLPRLKPLLPAFAEVSAGLGHMNLFPDEDGCLRRQFHVVGYLKDTYLPSFPLAIAALFKGVKGEDITVRLAEGIVLKAAASKGLTVPASGPRMGTPIKWHGGDGTAFRRTPFTTVLNNEVPTSQFRDKIVIIGSIAPRMGNRVVTALSRQVPEIEVVANAVANIVDTAFITRPRWAPFAELAALILAGVFVSFFLPRVRLLTGAAAVPVMLAGFGVVATYLLKSTDAWMRITPSMGVLVVGGVVVAAQRFFIGRRGAAGVSIASFETNKMLGLALQRKGMLDLALGKFSRLPIEEEEVKKLFYDLAADYELRGASTRALITYEVISREDGGYRDVRERISKLKEREEDELLGARGHDASRGEEDSGSSWDRLPFSLGAFDVIEEDGRDELGSVYRGRHGRSGRAVTIRTIRLAEFDRDIAGQFKEFLFREVDKAVDLRHPDIVTTYGRGEDRGRAYIVTEAVNGESIEANLSPGRLLTIRGTLQLVAHAADALEYAHCRNVVHHDIRPAHLLRVNNGHGVKVKDFGIGSVIASSSALAGAAPEVHGLAYMSPEKVSGKKADGRSDIFSLGVVLFEMLTGRKPFKGDDTAALILSIAKDPHPSVKALNPKIPRVVEKIVDKALAKNRDSRYQSAGRMAAHLNQVIARIDEVRRAAISGGNGT